MRRYLIVAVAGLLLVAGCTSGSDDENVGSNGSGGGGTASSTTLDPAEAAKAPGVTDTSVKIGVTYVDESAVKASGIDLRLGEYQKSYEVLVDQINEDGGINGRKLDLVFAPINPVGTAPAEEVCLELTEDDEVFAAVGFFLNDAVLCPVELHETAVIGGNQTADRLARAKAPWFTTTPGSEMPKQVVRAFDDHGDLDGKVAVFAARRRPGADGGRGPAPARRARRRRGREGRARRPPGRPDGNRCRHEGDRREVRGVRCGHRPAGRAEQRRVAQRHAERGLQAEAALQRRLVDPGLPRQRRDHGHLGDEGRGGRRSLRRRRPHLRGAQDAGLHRDARGRGHRGAGTGPGRRRTRRASPGPRRPA